MDSKRLACLLAFAGLMAIGCDGEPEFTFPARDQTCPAGETPPCSTSEAIPEDQRTFPVPDTFPEGLTNTYLVSAISIPAPEDGVAPGFNVDGINSGEGSTDGTCEELTADFSSPADPNLVGVDNALATIVPTLGSFLGDQCPGAPAAECLDSLLETQLAEGSLLLLMEVSDINDYQFDSSVSLQLFIGALPDGVMPEVGANGQLAAGQTFMTETDLGMPVPGDIINGRLRANAATLPLMINAEDLTITLTIANPEVRFNISEMGLSQGAIGGVITVQSLIDLAEEIEPGIGETVAGVIESFADVDPSAEDDQVCESLSVGIAFEAVTAVRN